MIITLVNESFNTNNSGTTISAMRFAEAYLQRGHKVRVITCGDPSKSGPDPATGCEMYYVPELIIPVATRLAHKQNTVFAKPVRSTIRAAISGADVVHIYQPWSLGSAARKIAKQLNVPAIAAYHTQPENLTYNIGLSWFPPLAHLIYFLMYISFYRKFAHIHCPSKFIAAQLRSHGYKAWLHVISNGVHPDFVPGVKRGKKPGDPVKILMIGRLSPEKRQDVLIRAVLASKYADRIQLYLAGLGPWEKKLKRMGRLLPNPPIFCYYDRKGLIELIRGCDLYVHASDIEIEGISCIEAFSCGLVPIISNSKRSASTQFAMSPDNLFKAGSAKSLAEKIDCWLDDPERLAKAGEIYGRLRQEYSIDRSIRQMEHVYASLSLKKRNDYHQGRIFRLASRLFYTVIAVPLLFVWTHAVLGVKVEGRKNLRRLHGALTLCNHVHPLDSALVGLALFPRKVVFSSLPVNLNSLVVGNIARLLGGVEVPDKISDLKVFFDEMELLLRKGRVVHFFPEGEIKPYDTNLRGFKRGAFYLAAQARVPLVPMSISFRKPKGLYLLYMRKPLMTLHIGKPIDPVTLDTPEDQKIRMEMAQEQMSNFLSPKCGYSQHAVN